MSVLGICTDLRDEFGMTSSTISKSPAFSWAKVVDRDERIAAVKDSNSANTGARAALWSKVAELFTTSTKPASWAAFYNPLEFSNQWWVVGSSADQFSTIRNGQLDGRQKFLLVFDSWCHGLASEVSARLQHRLEVLLEDLSPEELRNASAGSISQLLATLAANSSFKCPSVGLNKYGRFTATWTNGPKCRLTLDFLPDGRIDWTYVDARNGIGAASIGSGVITAEKLGKVLLAYDSMEWINR